MRLNRLIGVVVAGALLITGMIVPQENVKESQAKNYGISNPRLENGVTTWDKVKFGSYMQSVEIGEPEPIKWRILSVDENNNALLLADKGIDCKPYNIKDKFVTWETCTLRDWLNDDFYKEAFTSEEQAAIQKVIVKNDDNPSCGTEGGNDTSDKIYLLSIEEACNSAYGFDSIFDTQSAVKECKVTDYTRLNRAWRSSISSYAGNGDWWLRSPGNNSDYAVYVSFDGKGISSGNDVNNRNNAIRPALQINLSSSLVTDAGEVASDGTVMDSYDGYDNPKLTDNGTVWDCVYFGRYKQNNISEKEAIEWRVLSVDGDEALLLADKGIDCKQYYEGVTKVDEDGDSYTDYDCTWETSTLRNWLNEDFYNAAFTESEKAAIQQVTVKNDDNPDGAEGGNDTTDKVYLLSIEEASNSEYGFDSTFDTESTTRECKVTDYARMNGVWRSSISGYVGNGDWRLRSIGSYSDSAAYVRFNGKGYKSGNVNIGTFAIRPTLRINLLSSAWEAAGTVSAGGESIETARPTKAPTTESTEKPTETPSKAPTAEPTQTPETTKEPGSNTTEAPTRLPEATKEPTTQPTQAPKAEATAKPISQPTVNPAPSQTIEMLKLKLSSVRCKIGTKQITGKVSVANAVVKIKVGSKAYKKATVKGRKFTLKTARLKKNTKVMIKVSKSGYKTLIKSYKVR